jgi:hypothetical protein
MFTLTINTDNATFEDDLFFEIARILHDAANQVEGGTESGNLFDVNGNRIGRFAITEAN